MTATEASEAQVGVNRFLGHLRNYRRCSPATLVAYANELAQFLRWWQAVDPHMCLSEITQQLLLRYLAQLTALSPNTIRRRVHSLSAWLEFATRQGLVAANVARDLPLPRRERRLPHTPSPDQAGRLLEVAVTPVERATIWRLVTAGLRRAELANLDLADLTANETELCILGKGNRKRLGPTSLRHIFTRLLWRAGLADEGFSLHSMRHAYATMLVKAGVDLGTIRASWDIATSPLRACICTRTCARSALLSSSSLSWRWGAGAMSKRNLPSVEPSGPTGKDGGMTSLQVAQRFAKFLATGAARRMGNGPALTSPVEQGRDPVGQASTVRSITATMQKSVEATADAPEDKPDVGVLREHSVTGTQETEQAKDRHKKRTKRNSGNRRDDQLCIPY